jgi:hypothetical protein
VCGRKVQIRPNAFRAEFHSDAAAADSGFVCCFPQSVRKPQAAAAAWQKQSANLGVRSPAGQFHGYWSYTWQKTVRAERVDAISFGAHCAGDFNERSRLFVSYPGMPHLKLTVSIFLSKG